MLELIIFFFVIILAVFFVVAMIWAGVVLVYALLRKLVIGIFILIKWTIKILLSPFRLALYLLS